MKQLICMVALVVGCATIPVGQITQQEVIDFKGMSKKQIFDKSKLWIASSFRSYKEVAQYEDFAAGKIIGSGTTSWFWGKYIDQTTLFARIEIDVKDAKARFTATPVALRWENGESTQIGEIDRPTVEEHLSVFKKSYLTYMRGSAKDENW